MHFCTSAVSRNLRAMVMLSDNGNNRILQPDVLKLIMLLHDDFLMGDILGTGCASSAMNCHLGDCRTKCKVIHIYARAQIAG